jgi:hypothetical protein
MKTAVSMRVMGKRLCPWQSTGDSTNGGSNVNIKVVMRGRIDAIVCICMMVIMYLNLTYIPSKPPPREVVGQLVRIVK